MKDARSMQTTLQAPTAITDAALGVLCSSASSPAGGGDSRVRARRDAASAPGKGRWR